ncbi:MAG: hypothetical protein V4621_00890 [Pseudomonadota bacterium]
MMDFGFSELLLVICVALFAIGPKQLPDVLYTVGRWVRRLQYIRYNMTQHVDTFLQATDLHDLQRTAPITPSRTRIGPYTPDDDDTDEAAADADIITANLPDAPTQKADGE